MTSKWRSTSTEAKGLHWVARSAAVNCAHRAMLLAGADNERPTVAGASQMVWDAVTGSWQEALGSAVFAGGVVGLALLLRAGRNRQHRGR